ncbi:MAG: agmatine deiminase family protein [Flavobacteriales bacterium]
MKYALLYTFAMAFALGVQAQSNDEPLPRWLTTAEEELMRTHSFAPVGERGITSPPSDFTELRTMAEWEEIQSLTIGWTYFFPILKQIVSASQDQCEVIILSENISETENYLLSNNAGGPALADLSNISILDVDLNSIWMRDYAANTVYGSGVDDLILVDWIYNRPRPDDDASPQAVADHLGVDLYCTTSSPTDLVNTGGNFMADGFGSGFASNLILEENEAGNPYDVSTKSESQIDQIMSDWMGLDRYIKMPTLPNDLIHHIDMHMKLLDEERILFSEYPMGLSDGPQINANMLYVLQNFQSTFGTNYEVIRIPAPPDGGQYPILGENNASYKTYSNAVFVNNKVLLPTYETQFDTTAIRIWEESLPGYEIVGIDCDDENSDIISLSGAIHCITHSVGVEDPLLISHQALNDTEDDQNSYEVAAMIRHRSEIASAELFWRADEGDLFQSASMLSLGDDQWAADIPAQAVGTTVNYYIRATAESGKEQNRPMPAPTGYWSFKVLGNDVSVPVIDLLDFESIYPNPAAAITCIPVQVKASTSGVILLRDMLGKTHEEIHRGLINSGDQRFFFDASNYASGIYFVEIQTPSGNLTQKLIIK